MNLARALYIPALISFLVGVYSLCQGEAKYAALIGLYGAMIAIVGFCAAIRSAKLINLPKAS